MRTARSLTVSRSICPPPHMLPYHACPPSHVCPPSMHVSCHAHPSPPPLTPPLPHTSPAMHASPCWQNSWHTLLKILPCPNFVAGGNNHVTHSEMKSVSLLHHVNIPHRNQCNLWLRVNLSCSSCRTVWMNLTLEYPEKQPLIRCVNLLVLWHVSCQKNKIKILKCIKNLWK